MPSSSVHSRYQRHLTDLPWGTRAVRIQLIVRKFVCRYPSCKRRIFTERLPDLVAAYARKTQTQGTPVTTIARRLGISRPTVYAYLRRDTPPAPRSPQRSGQVLRPYMPYLIGR